MPTSDKGVPFCRGLEDPKCTQRALEAEQRINTCDYNAYMALRGLVSDQNSMVLKDSRYEEEELSHNEVMVLLLSNIFDGEVDVARSWLEEVQEILRDREALKDEFLSALAGHPPRESKPAKVIVVPLNTDKI